MGAKIMEKYSPNLLDKSVKRNISGPRMDE
jgi:hypothetical protein